MAEQDTADVQAKPKKKLPPYWVQLGAQVGGNPVDYTGLFGSKGIGAFLSAATVAGYALFGSIYAFANGTVIAPAQTWADEGTSGRYRVSAGVFAESVGGAQKMNWDATRLQLVSGYALDLAGMTSGSVAFWGAGGRFTQDVANFFWDNTNKQLELADGSVGNPAYSFTAATNTGFYRIGATSVAWALAGTARLNLQAGQLQVIGGGPSFALASAINTIFARWEGQVANTTGIINSTNAQTFTVYNTGDGTYTNFEGLRFAWSANVVKIQVFTAGTGTTRNLDMCVGGSSFGPIVIRVGTSANGGLILGCQTSSATPFTNGMVVVGNGVTHSATSSTTIGTIFNTGFIDGGTNSTTVAYLTQFSSTINYTGASRTGQVYLQYLKPTLTSLPTGNNGGIVFSSTFTGSTFPPIRLFNTVDEVTDFECLDMSWGVAANVFGIRTIKGGTGTARSFRIFYGNTSTTAIDVPGSTGTAIIIAGSSASVASVRTIIANNTQNTATSGTNVGLRYNENLNPSSTSTMVAYGIQLNPTVNYAAGTPGAGKVNLVYLAPTLTAQPTGQNGGVVFSSSFSSATFPAARWHNQNDEDTNREDVRAGFAVGTANIWTLGSFAAGTGTLRGIQIGVTGNAVGFLGATPAARTAAYTITNPVTRRTFDCTTVTLQQLAEAVGTVIADQQTFGLFG